MTQPIKKDLPNPMPDPKPGVPKPGDRRDLPGQTPEPGDNRDLPSPFQDDKAGQTATDQSGGKAVRGWENIDKKGHRQDEGDTADEREGQKGG